MCLRPLPPQGPYTAGGGGGTPPPPPPLPMLEADSQNFASAPSVPRGFKLQKFRPAFGDHRGPWEEGGPSQTPLTPLSDPPPPSNASLPPPPPPGRWMPVRTCSSADACLSWQKVQRREANRRRHRLTKPTTKALCQPPPPSAPPLQDSLPVTGGGAAPVFRRLCPRA